MADIPESQNQPRWVVGVRSMLEQREFGHGKVWEHGIFFVPKGIEAKVNWCAEAVDVSHPRSRFMSDKSNGALLAPRGTPCSGF